LCKEFEIADVPKVVPLKYSRCGNRVIVALAYSDKIEFNKYSIAYLTCNKIISLLKHELIHVKCIRELGYDGHGKIFKDMCYKYGLTKEEARAVN